VIDIDNYNTKSTVILTTTQYTYFSSYLHYYYYYLLLSEHLCSAISLKISIGLYYIVFF